MICISDIVLNSLGIFLYLSYVYILNWFLYFHCYICDDKHK
jgi:hypothetical protein